MPSLRPLNVPEPTLLSLVIPVFDEAARVAAGLRAVRDFLDGFGSSNEIVLVDDGSRDGTIAIARPLLLPSDVLLQEPHRGKGGAVRAGMLRAGGDYRIFLDIDLATPVTFVGPCLERLREGADVVIGSRRSAGARIERHQAAVREWLGRGFSGLSRLVTGAPVADFTCGFKGFTRDAALALFTRQRVMNWSFDAELLFLASRLGLAVEELPVVWRDDRSTKVRLGRDVLGSLTGLLAIRMNHLKGRYR